MNTNYIFGVALLLSITACVVLYKRAKEYKRYFKQACFEVVATALETDPKHSHDPAVEIIKNKGMEAAVSQVMRSIQQ